MLYEYLLSIDGIYTDKYKDNSPEMQELFNYYKAWAFYGVDSLKWDAIAFYLRKRRKVYSTLWLQTVSTI